jgi:hypothetical protein
MKALAEQTAVIPGRHQWARAKRGPVGGEPGIQKHAPSMHLD